MRQSLPQENSNAKVPTVCECLWKRESNPAPLSTAVAYAQLPTRISNAKFLVALKHKRQGQMKRHVPEYHPQR